MNVKTNNNTEILIVSPHCDDACFSLGGSILKHCDKNITVWDIFSVQDYTILSDTPQEAKLRILEEEMSFIQTTNAQVIFEELPDAYLRGYKKLSSILCSNVSKIQESASEKSIYYQILKAFGRIYGQLKPRCIALPLGCGGHIDHLLAREAGINWWEKLENKPKLFLYEELPYSLNSKWLHKSFEELVNRGFELVPQYSVIDEYLDKKINMVNLYKSQIKEKDSKLFKEYALNIKSDFSCERMWSINIRKKVD